MSNYKDLELAVLRSLAGTASVSSAEAISVIDSTGVVAEDFQENAHRTLWAAIEAKIRAGETLDVVSLSSSLQGLPRGLVVEVLLSPELGSAEQRMSLLHERAMRSRYLEALRSVAQVVKDTSQPLSSAVAGAARLLSQWQDDAKHVRTMDDGVFPVLDAIESLHKGEREPTLQTGLEAWDAICGGLPPTLTVIGALPGVGKSAVVASILRNLARRNVPVGLMSLEDERSWLVQRLLADASAVPLFLLANKPLRPAQMARVAASAEGVHQLLTRVLVDDRGGLSTSAVVASARQMVSRGARAIFVDHLGEIRLERSERHDLDISEALSELRRLAKTYHVPVVVVAHLRRRDGLGIHECPKLTDFAFSSGVERMARLAIGLYQCKFGDDVELRAVVLKQTQGASNIEFRLRLNRSAAIVEDAPIETTAQRLYAAGES